MMKKGASHVDWAISMGIFLVFIMLVLIFIQPGIEPAYKADALLKIIENDLKKNAYQRVDKQILVVNSNTICSAATCRIRIRKASGNGLDPDWVRLSSSSRGYTAVVNRTQTKYDEAKIAFDAYNEYCDICAPLGICCGGYYPEIPTLYHVLDFKSYLERGENVFYILRSTNFTYKTYEDKSVYIDLKDTPALGTDSWPSDVFLDGYNFTYKFGVSEVYTGFSEEKLNVLYNKNYEALKKEWGVPADKEFRINITNLTAYECYYTAESECKEGIKFFKGFIGQIPLQISVAVKEWKDWILTPEGKTAPVEARIELW